MSEAELIQFAIQELTKEIKDTVKFWKQKMPLGKRIKKGYSRAFKRTANRLGSFSDFMRSEGNR